MILKVVKWSNGMVMVFDQFGRQMPEFQGEWEEKKDQIKRYSHRYTRFYKGKWENTIEEVKKEDLFK